jgi:zinc/manganese transport system substrate-binding protein
MVIRRIGSVVAVATAATALAAVLAGCGSSSAAPAAPPAAGRPAVVTSTDVYGAVVQAVGGDLVTVRSLIHDPAADPHSYESTPADAAAVAGATLVVANGGGYDDFLPRLVESSGAHPTMIDVVQLSGRAAGAPAGSGKLNEHVWYDLPTVKALAGQLATDLGAADPADAARYTANARAFGARIDGLAADTAAIGAAHRGTRVAVTEPVPDYLLEAAGLVDATPPAFTEAIEEDTDPPASALAATLQLFGPPQPVAALVLNAQTTTPTTDQVRAAAQTGGIPVVEVTETLPTGATDYADWMGAQIDALAAALNRG